MKFKYFIFSIAASFSLNAQIDSSLIEMITETNFFFKEHQKTHPDFGLVSLEKHHLTLNKLAEMGIKVEGEISTNSDSIHSLLVVEYYALKIDENITKILNHPEALPMDFLDYFDQEYSHSWLSGDGKFGQISYYSNNGGTYRVQETFLFYKPSPSQLIFSHLNNILVRGNGHPFEQFHPDGYGRVHEIKDSTITKYVLTGGVKACSTCYYEWISLVYFNGKEFVFEFNLEVESRDYNESIEYYSESKEIKVRYYTDDLIPTCACSFADDEDLEDYIDLEAEAAVTQEGTFCYCLFTYDGKNFKLYEASNTPPPKED